MTKPSDQILTIADTLRKAIHRYEGRKPVYVLVDRVFLHICNVSDLKALTKMPRESIDGLSQQDKEANQVRR